MNQKIKVRIKSVFWIWLLIVISLLWWMVAIVEVIICNRYRNKTTYTDRVKTDYKKLWLEMTESWDAALTGVRKWK